MTEGSSEGGWTTVTGEPVGSLHTETPVLAERAVAAAVPRAAGPDPGGDLRPLLQVQGDAVQLQGADAAAETFLSGRSASCQQEQRTYTQRLCSQSVMR